MTISLKPLWYHRQFKMSKKNVLLFFFESLVEKDDRCSSSSYGNAGLIVPSHSIPLAAPGVVVQGLKWMFNPESPFYIKPRFRKEFLSWL
jgi:hypothetical protein